MALGQLDSCSEEEVSVFLSIEEEVSSEEAVLVPAVVAGVVASSAEK